MSAPSAKVHRDADTPARVSSDRIVRALIVDADEGTRARYRAWFQGIGCEVTEAADGREALTKALVHPPRLVVTDVGLAFLDGYALCEILRRDHATAHARILVIADNGSVRDVDRARTAGADAVLTKPITVEQVLTAAGRLLTARDGAEPASATAVENSAYVARRSEQPRLRLSKSFTRPRTTTPPTPPPDLVCPSCDQPLTYVQSYVGGVNARHAEQWDHYVCPASCGTFEYRQRTRRLRHLA